MNVIVKNERQQLVCEVECEVGQWLEFEPNMVKPGEDVDLSMFRVVRIMPTWNGGVLLKVERKATT
jgi:hypothetical protein